MMDATQIIDLMLFFFFDQQHRHNKSLQRTMSDVDINWTKQTVHHPSKKERKKMHVMK